MILRAIVFFAILIFAVALKWWDWNPNAQASWNLAIAVAVEQAVHLLGSPLVRTGSQLIDPISNRSIVVIGECNGFEASMILMTGIIVYPSCLKARVLGVVAGFISVQLVNIIRILSLFFLKAWDENVFEFAHLYIFSGIIMLHVVLFLFLWLQWQRVQCKPS